ncbi:hypothetical protein [Herminiimonas sp. CN]|uniref:hypothetical protein n=1 Tax=Herminiimonas sp. CN TaxID=1349818 RepID=UPI00047327A3|nr:hypothetical protein [Herminiimonas sp. CN]
MTIRLSMGARNSLAGPKGFGATFEAGVIYVYSGPQPLSADNPVAGTLLGIVTKDAAAFVAGTPTNGLSFAVPVMGVVSKQPADNWKFIGLADGTAGWFRLMGNAYDALGASTTLSRLDGSVGTSGADLNLSNINVVVGSPNTIDIFQYEFPA